MNDFDTLCARLTQAVPNLELRHDEPMSRHTTFKVGGPARLMALPETEEEVITAVRLARELGIEPLFVGNGSDLLVDEINERLFDLLGDTAVEFDEAGRPALVPDYVYDVSQATGLSAP